MSDFMNAGGLPDFKCRGTRASVALHDQQLRHFLQVWQRAKASGVSLPEVDDPDYVSFDALLRHVFRWARTYMIWCCEHLGLPESGMKAVPDVEVIASEAESYMGHLLKVWWRPLSNVPAERFNEVYPSPWGIPYCIDAMLEHAVMHPVKHRFQLEELLGER